MPPIVRSSRQFDLDDEYLEDLKAEIIEAKRLAVDEGGTVLVWTGETAPAPVPEPSRPDRQQGAEEDRVASEGERRQLTVGCTPGKMATFLFYCSRMSCAV